VCQTHVVTGHLDDLLRAAAASQPDRLALVDTSSGRRLTWAELDFEVGRVARGLNELGLVAGYRVVLAVSNRTEFVQAYLAVLRARLVAVPVNPRAATGELVRMIADCGARLVIADAGTVGSVRQAVAGLVDALQGADNALRARSVVPVVAVVGAPVVPPEIEYDALRADEPQVSAGVADPESLAVLLYTSGTSGRPRAAMLTHRALRANVEQAGAVDPPMITGDDVVLGVLPLFHVYGLNAVLGQVLYQGSRLVLVDGFEAEGTLDVIADEAVTVVPVAPPVFAHWSGVADLEERLSSVRLVLSGSAPLSPELVSQFTGRTGIEVHEGYGLTEAAPVVTSTLRSATRKPGSVGSALPGVELRLVGDAGRAPAGEDPGEIWVRGDNLFSGYWPDGSDGPDYNGWYATGDVGFLDADGDLFLVDRLKELVIVSGFNVYPFEVEEVILEVPGVREAAVIGVPDPVTGEAVIAYVTMAADTSADVVTDAVLDHCALRLARFKQPREVQVVDELPHTAIGKVAKGRLRARRRDAELLQ
jgi:long-chain acyl-CoA synthetase